MSYDTGAIGSLKFGQSEVSVPGGGTQASPVDRTSYVNAASGSGKILVFDPGYVSIDYNLITPAALSGMAFEGTDKPEFVTNSAHPTDGTTITWLHTPTAAAAPSWANCAFRRLYMTAPASLTARSIFSNTSNQFLTFDDVCFYDVVGGIVIGAAGEIFFDRCSVLQSSTPPAAINQTIGFISGRLVVRDCLFDFNPTGPAGFIIGLNGSATGPYGPWYVERSRFLPSNQWFIDAGIDGEAGGASNGFTSMYLHGNEFWNCKVYNVGIQRTDIVGNLFRSTSVLSGAQLCENIVVSSTAVNGTVGTLNILQNDFWHDNFASTTAQEQMIKAIGASYISECNIRGNSFIRNGATTASPSGGDAIIEFLQFGTGAGSTYIDNLDISDNTIGFTSLPGTPFPIIVLGSNTASGTSTFQRVAINRNTLIGTTAGTGMKAATVNGAVATELVTFGLTTKTQAFTDVIMEGNDASAVSLSTPTAAAPSLYNTAGTTTATTFIYRQNTPDLANKLTAQTGALASGILAYTPLATGLFEVGGTVSVGSWTTPANSQFEITVDDVLQGAKTVIFSNNPGSGAMAANITAANTLNNFPAVSINQVGGNAMTFKTATFTGTPSYSVYAYIRQIA